jgi:AhpD family alkylhydroperoxidase
MKAGEEIRMTNTPQMEPRLDYAGAAPGAAAAMYAVERYVRDCGLERRLLELVKLRASQINGCVYCVDMHTKDARAHGETEQRLCAVVVWREAPFFTEWERAALAWAEAVTSVSRQQVPDTVFEIARKEFSEKELVDLTMAVIAINGWHRLAISFRTVGGTFSPHRHRKAPRKRNLATTAPGRSAFANFGVDPVNEQIKSEAGCKENAGDDGATHGHLTMAGQVGFESSGEQPDLHDQQQDDEGHGAIDSRKPAVLWRVGVHAPSPSIRTPRSCPPFISSVTRGSARCGGPCRTEPSAIEKKPWWQGHSSRFSSFA